MVGSRTAVTALALCALGARMAHAASCSEAEGSSIFSAYSAFQESVSADCSADQCAQACLGTQRLLSTALPDCEYVDGTNYRQQVLGHIASCDAAEAPTHAPVAATDPTEAPIYTPTLTANPTEAPVPVVSPTETPTETPPAVTAAPVVATSGSQEAVEACSREQEDSILATYSAFQGNLSVVCAADKCASACMETQRRVAALLPDCQYADGTNYHEQVAAALSSCGGSPDDVGYAPSTLLCSSTQSNATVILYSQYEAELREACDDDKCSAQCVGIVNQLAAVLPDCFYSDGINYRNESVGIIDACGNASTVGSGSRGLGPNSAATATTAASVLPALLGLLTVLAACF